MSTENLPSGPIPADLENTVRDIMRDVGISVLKKKTLRKRLETKYNIEFSSHAKTIDEILEKLLKTREFQKELAKAEKQHGPIGGKGKRHSSSSKADDAKQVKKRPDDYPKAALSAYMLFVNDKRESVKDQNPDMKVTDVVRKLGELWGSASDDAKEKYKRMAEDDKKRYDREMEEYKSRGGEVFKRGGDKSKKAPKDENAPKRPLSAYMFFMNDFRKRHADLKPTEMSKAGAAEWNSLSEEKKQPFEAMSQKDKQRYQREMENRGK